MAGISTASRKAKGRRFQQLVRDVLRRIGLSYGLVDDDCCSTGMGQSGVDVILSPAARKVFDWYIECKNVESLNVWATFVEHFEKYKDKAGLKILFHTKNRGEPLATLRMVDFFNLIEENLELKNDQARERTV